MLKKPLFIVLAFICLGLGILGIALPLLPTTPFLLLSATLFAKSSDRLYAWLLNHKRLGTYIRAFREDRSIPLRIKVISISMLWISILLSTFWAAKGRLWLQLVLIAIAIAVTLHILSYKTRR